MRTSRSLWWAAVDFLATGQVFLRCGARRLRCAENELATTKFLPPDIVKCGAMCTSGLIRLSSVLQGSSLSWASGPTVSFTVGVRIRGAIRLDHIPPSACLVASGAPYGVYARGAFE